MSAQTSRQGLILEPLDVLLFRDGRPLVAGWQVESALPLPQTLTGTIRTWLLHKAGCDFERLGEHVRKGVPLAQAATLDQPEEVAAVLALEVRGPWFAVRHREDEDRWTPLVPMPANVVVTTDDEGDTLQHLAPLKTRDLPGWSPRLPGMRPLWRYSSRPAEKAEGFLTWEGLKAYLEGSVPSSDHRLTGQDLYDIDARTGIAVGALSRSVEEGAIYGAGYLALRPGVAFYAEVIDRRGVLEALGTLGAFTDIVRFGGDSKRSRVTAVPTAEWPTAEPANGQGVAILLTTPCPVDPASIAGSVDDAWLPSPLREGIVSAAVPGYRAFSGWDLARRGPKPTRFAIDAGAVYFLSPEFDASAIHSLCSAEDSAAGWGHFVKGVWNYV